MATSSRAPILNLLLVESINRPELVNRYVGHFFKRAEPARHEDCRPLRFDLQHSNEQVLGRLLRSVHRASVGECSSVRHNVAVEPLSERSPLVKVGLERLVMAHLVACESFQGIAAPYSFTSSCMNSVRRFTAKGESTMR